MLPSAKASRYGLLFAKAFCDMLPSAKASSYGLLFIKAFPDVLRSAKASSDVQRIAKASRGAPRFARASRNMLPFWSSVEPDRRSSSFPVLTTTDLLDVKYIP